MKIKIFTVTEKKLFYEIAKELEENVNKFLSENEKIDFNITPIFDKNGHIQQIMLTYINK